MAFVAGQLPEVTGASDASLADAQDAGLRWVTDETPGIRRLRAGKGFRYVRADGSPADPHAVKRIRALAIPPAWVRVWICERADGHIQATGYDARGRKQYRYHEAWRRQRDENKFGRLLGFARGLPALRARVRADMARPDLDRRKVLATIVRLLETTSIRIGNDEYMRQNGSFGLTTLRNRHAIIRSSGFRLRFRGKGGKMHEVDVADRRLARVVRSCQELPSQELFQYMEPDGTVRRVGSGDVNEYLREVTGADISAKDFRTWAATVRAAQLLASRPIPPIAAERKRIVLDTVAEVARELRNTRAVCRRSYIHPLVIEAFERGTPLPEPRGPERAARGCRGIERAVMRLLHDAGEARERKAS